MSTITVPSYLNMSEDVHGLHRAFRGFGCDEKRVIQILGHRTQPQRTAIADAYQRQYGESIHRRLKSELHGKLEKAMLLWMMSPAQRDATLVNDSTKGLGTRDRALIGIICSRTPSQIYEIKQAYHAMYGQTLERQIEGDTSGDYRKLLLALVRGNRSETTYVDPNFALADAHALYQAGVARLGTDENAFIHILTTRSPAQLNLTLQYYKQTYGHDFERAVKKETSGQFEDALLAVVQCTCYPARFFAQELYSSMKGMGTNDQDLIRVLTTRAEMDMYYIKMEFQSLYRTTLEQMITGDTSGDYRHFLLTLVGGA